MIEIAISLGVIGIALVAIIGVLPMGMSVQKENREETIINQDATILMEAIRNGARGGDDLTNYVYAIVITNMGGLNVGYINPTLANQMNFSKAASFPTVPANQWYPILANGGKVVGLLSTPKFVTVGKDIYTNRIIACIRSMSGLATEKPPQENDILIGDSFSYRLVSENVAVPVADTASAYGRQLTNSLHELRLTFMWPQRPSGTVGAFRQTFRALIAGQLMPVFNNGNQLYFFQSQSFTNAP